MIVFYADSFGGSLPYIKGYSMTESTRTSEYVYELHDPRDL